MTRTKLLGFIAGLLLAVAAFAPSVAGAWAPAGSATIKPGVMTFTDGGQCTRTSSTRTASNVYIGQAAHCSGTGGQTETNGCTAARCRSARRSTSTARAGPGRLVYNSWLTMQARGETNPDTCQFNDLALVKLDPADVGSVNPSVPGFGGPTGLGSSAAMLGDTVYTLRQLLSAAAAITKLSPKQGIVAQSEGNGWSRTVYTVTPGIPGDSGSGFMGADRQGDRRAEHAAARPGAGLERGRRPAPRARLPARAHIVHRRRARQRHRAVQAEPGRRDSRAARAADSGCSVGAPLLIDGASTVSLAEDEDEDRDDRDPDHDADGDPDQAVAPTQASSA